MTYSKTLHHFLLILVATFLFSTAYAQVSISTDGSKAHPSAMLDIKSTTKGVLVPRLNSTQRISISNPADGLVVYDTDLKEFMYFKSGIGWVKISGENYWLQNANGIYFPEPKNVGIRTTPVSTNALTVLGETNGIGSNIGMFTSNDTWHSALILRNNLSQYSFAAAGPNNTELLPNNFGIVNHNNPSAIWALTINHSNNNIGIGHTNGHPQPAKSVLHVFSGDVNIEQIGSGIIMKSPNGQCWRVTVSDTGTFVSTAIPCP